jgi:hypothetical protein
MSLALVFCQVHDARTLTYIITTLIVSKQWDVTLVLAAVQLPRVL